MKISGRRLLPTKRRVAWPKRKATRVSVYTIFGFYCNSDRISGGDAPRPFNTQFFNDDDDGPAFDDLYEGDVDGAVPEDAGEQDLLAATHSMTRRVRPETVNYAKRAKRVDVRKLKENIWKGLDITVARKEEQEDEEMVAAFFHDSQFDLN